MKVDRQFYTDNFYQLSRIAGYQVQRFEVIAILFFSALLLYGGVSTGRGGFYVIAIFLVLVLSLRLWSKFRMQCPNCNAMFFGPFKLLMPKRQHCQNCGVCLYPENEFQSEN